MYNTKNLARIEHRYPRGAVEELDQAKVPINFNSGLIIKGVRLSNVDDSCNAVVLLLLRAGWNSVPACFKGGKWEIRHIIMSSCGTSHGINNWWGTVKCSFSVLTWQQSTYALRKLYSWISKWDSLVARAPANEFKQ